MKNNGSKSRQEKGDYIKKHVQILTVHTNMSSGRNKTTVKYKKINTQNKTEQKKKQTRLDAKCGKL